MRRMATNGLPIERLAQEAFNALVMSCGLTPDWDAADQERWFRVAAFVVQEIDIPEGDEATRECHVPTMAKLCHEVYMGGDDLPGWETFESAEQLAWQAVVRHLANWIDSDASMEFDAKEWAEWLAGKLAAV